MLTDRDHQLTPPPVGGLVEGGSPAVGDRWHEDVTAGVVLVDRFARGQPGQVPETVMLGMAERRTGECVRVGSADRELGLAGAGSGGELLADGPVGDLRAPPGVPVVELARRDGPVEVFVDRGDGR